MPLLKTSSSWADLIGARSTQARPGAPVCMTCGRFVDFNGMTGDPGEGAPGVTTYAKYVVKHHGAYEEHTFDMGSTNWDVADLEQMARRKNWFDPTKTTGGTGGVGVRIENPGEHDDGDAKILSTGVK
jgi:hypothetical protein